MTLLKIKEGENRSIMNLADISPETERLLRDSIRKLKKLLYKDLFTREQGVDYYIDLVWEIKRNSSLEDLKPISYFLSLIGIYNIEGSIFEFRHGDYPVHVKVEKERNKFIINVHIDIIRHILARYSKFTSELLSELTKFLKRMDTESTTILLPEEHPVEKEHNEVRSEDTESIELVREIEEQESETELDQIEIVERIRESRNSVRNEVKIYQKRIKTLKKLKDQEKRRRQENREVKMHTIEKIKENRKKIFKDIIDNPFYIWKKEALLNNKSEIDEDEVNREIKSLFSIIFGHLKSRYKGFFVMEFNTFYNKYYHERFSEVRNNIAEKVEEKPADFDLPEDIEEDNLEHEEERELKIIQLIDDSTDTEYYQILHDARVNEQFHLDRKEIKNRFITSFKNRLEEETNFGNIEDIMERFLITLQERFNEIFKKLETRLDEILRPRANIKTRRSRRVTKEDFIYILIIIVLTTLIVVWLVEYDQMANLENWEWIDAHVWIPPVSGFLIAIVAVFFIILVQKKDKLN